MHFDTSHFEKLSQLLKADPTLSADDCACFLEIWEPFEAGRKEILTVAGEKEKYLYFVNSGVQRIYYFDDQHREATIIFTYEPSFGGVLDSFLLQSPSKYYYETLTPSSFIRTTHSKLIQLIISRPSLHLWVTRGISAALSGVLERLVEIQSFTSEEKFRAFLKRSPHMLQLVPHKYLANYMGIDATNFSKLMNRIRI